MAITFQIPPDLEHELRSRLGDLDKAAREAMAVELYRQAKLSHFELSQALGLSRLQTDAVLKRHHVTEDLPSVEELRQELDERDAPEKRQ